MSDDDEVAMNVDDGEITTNVDDDETSMDVDEPPDQCPAFVTFNCSTPGCVKQYRLYNNLVRVLSRRSSQIYIDFLPARFKYAGVVARVELCRKIYFVS